MDPCDELYDSLYSQEKKRLDPLSELRPIAAKMSMAERATLLVESGIDPNRVAISISPAVICGLNAEGMETWYRLRDLGATISMTDYICARGDDIAGFEEIKTAWILDQGVDATTLIDKAHSTTSMLGALLPILIGGGNINYGAKLLRKCGDLNEIIENIENLAKVVPRDDLARILAARKFPREQGPEHL